MGPTVILRPLPLQAFTLTTSVLCLPHGAMLATVAAIVAFGFDSTSPNVGAWWVHHARGVALQVLSRGIDMFRSQQMITSETIRDFIGGVR